MTKRIRKATIAATVGLASLIGSYVNADPLDISAFDARTKVDYEHTAKDRDLIRTTVGIAPEGSYGQAPTVIVGNFAEVARAYNVTEIINGKTTNYTAEGIKVPEFTIGDVKNRAIIYGAEGDKEGAGFESWHKLGKDDLVTITLDAERLTEPIYGTHLGGGIDYKLTNNLQVGVGYDNIKTSAGNTDQILVNGIYNFGNNLVAGAAFVTKTNLDDSRTNTIQASLLKYDKELGARFIGSYTWNDEKDSRSLNGELIIAQNHTLGAGKDAVSWTVSNHLREDPSFPENIVPQSISVAEFTPMAHRSFSGLAFAIDGGITQVEDKTFGTLHPQIGYKFPSEVFGVKLGISGGYKVQFSEDNNHQDSLEAGILARKGNLSGGFFVSQPISGQDNDPIIKVGGQLQF